MHFVAKKKIFLSFDCISQIKLPSYKLLNLFLPYVVRPPSAKCTLAHPEGSVRAVTFKVSIDVDRTPVDICTLPDAGSKPWLLAHALHGEHDPYGVGKDSSAPPEGSEDGSSRNIGTAEDLDDHLPEDRFHIKLPKGVDQYTGVRLGGDGDAEGGKKKQVQNLNDVLKSKEEDELLPEDMFHKRDAASSVIIHQREQAIKDKWAKHEKYVRNKPFNKQFHLKKIIYICIIIFYSNKIYMISYCTASSQGESRERPGS